MKKRVLTIQDYSCLGRCSLTVALPTISACGVECVGLPTALFSNHTAFPSWTYKDLSGEIPAIVKQWEAYDLSFDLVYTGYLSTEQIPMVKAIIEDAKAKGSLIVVDPAMADEGKLYPSFGPGHVEAMRELVKEADVIVPNFTEACLLAGIPYSRDVDPLELSERLASLGPKKIVITSIPLEDGQLGIQIHGSGDYLLERETLPGVYHGTGDLFASALVGCLAREKSLEESAEIADAFVREAIRKTIDEGLDGRKAGPEFEPAIPMLIDALR